MGAHESFLQLRDGIALALAEGASLTDVEDLLASAPLDRDERDALWLYAWGLAEGRRISGPAPVPTGAPA